MRKIIISIVLFIVSIALLIAGLELFSSYKASANINGKAPVQTIKSIAIKASPEKIWTIMSKVDEWAQWHRDVQSPKIAGAFQPGTSFDWKSGGLTIHSTIHTAIPYSKIGWSGKAFGAFAIHNWTFTKMNGYTEVLVEESMEGWLVKLLHRKFQTGLEQSLDTWLNNLKSEAEKQ
ncbi:SRPBCC family protein [Chitinophagaceae bacterium 26-R-25]|nr:SRPBCC family protein [Chitinophagaceae bacterium 26-R-25]